MKSTLLIVDDEPALSEILKKHLHREGYEVLTATNGREALALVRQHGNIRLLLLDLKMPGMSGLDCLKKLRRLRGIKSTPAAVIMTAYGNPSSAREAMSLGAVDYLTKPFDLRQVSMVAREVLSRQAVRKLVYVPILHTSHDMGTLAGSMKETFVRKFGPKKWEGHVKAIDEMWTGIGEKIRRLDLPWDRVKVYQDGLPVCAKEREIVADLAKTGSPNHRLVQGLLHRGATLVGTEDPQLLVKEYQHYKRIMTSKNHAERERLIHQFEREEKDLMMKRDQFIRNRIETTLKGDEIGILFMGLLHRVDEQLPSDIEVSYLIDRLPFRRSFEMEMVA